MQILLILYQSSSADTFLGDYHFTKIYSVDPYIGLSRCFMRLVWGRLTWTYQEKPATSGVEEVGAGESEGVLGSRTTWFCLR